MITREQIEAEIAELTSEIHRRVAAVKGIFAEVDGLRAEAELLNKLLELRTQVESQADTVSLLLLGFVRQDGDEPTAFCAVTWSGPRDLPSDTRIFLKQEWQSLLPKEILPYFVKLSNDWKQLVQTRPASLLSMLRELSVGPLRTMEQATMRKDKAVQFIKEQLGDVEAFPGVVLVK